MAPQGIGSPAALIQALERAYASRDVAFFTSLLAHDAAANADYVFTLHPAVGLEENLWGFDQEIWLHARLFDPEGIPPTDPALPPDLRVRAIDVSFNRSSEFVEPDSVYLDQGNPDGLDRERWRALRATYVSNAIFELENGSVFTIQEEDVYFLIVEDVHKTVGEEGKFLLLRWEDGCSTPGSGDDCWNEIKALYLGL